MDLEALRVDLYQSDCNMINLLIDRNDAVRIEDTTYTFSYTYTNIISEKLVLSV